MSARAKHANRRIAALLLATILGVGLLGLSHGASPTRAQQAPDPVAVLQSFLDARNSGDALGAAATFTDNAILVAPPAAGPCSRQSPCIGRPAILANIVSEIANHQCNTLLDTEVSGSVVTGHAEVRNDGTRANGIERLELVIMVAVQQGKIAAQYALLDATDPQTAAYVAILAGTQAPGPAIPNPPTPCG